MIDEIVFSGRNLTNELNEWASLSQQESSTSSCFTGNNMAASRRLMWWCYVMYLMCLPLHCWSVGVPWQAWDGAIYPNHTHTHIMTNAITFHQLPVNKLMFSHATFIGTGQCFWEVALLAHYINGEYCRELHVSIDLLVIGILHILHSLANLSHIDHLIARGAVYPIERKQIW